MDHSVKPILVVSQCLEFAKCRYNGEMIPSQFIRKLSRHVIFKPVCPEVEIGLGVPRDTIRLVEEKGHIKLVQPTTQRDLTESMKKFSAVYLKSLKDVDGFILKSGSPSCGMKEVKIYPAMDNPMAKAKGAGMFAARVLENFPDAAIEDEGRLTNFRIREHFLTKLFTLARFRELKRVKTMKALVGFHAQHKLLLMAYSQKQLKILGGLVANSKKANIRDIFNEYEVHLKDAFQKDAKYTSHVNVVMHALGYFKDDVTAKEKKHFLDLLDRFRQGAMPLSAILSILQSWIIKYDKKYLLEQIYFEPYPQDLVEITDSGKGRDN